VIVGWSSIYIRVDLAQHDLNSGNEAVLIRKYVLEIHIHPEYDVAWNSYDLALFKLTDPIEFTFLSNGCLQSGKKHMQDIRLKSQPGEEPAHFEANIHIQQADMYQEKNQIFKYFKSYVYAKTY
jgi:hypothetical protein